MALSAAGEPAVHFAARFAVPTAYYAAVAVVVGGALMTLSKHAWGRSLLLKCAARVWHIALCLAAPARTRRLSGRGGLLHSLGACWIPCQPTAPRARVRARPEPIA